LTKIQSAALAAFCVYEYNSVDIVDRVEAFSTSAISYWLRIKQFDMEAITEKFDDSQNTVYLRDYAKAYEQVMELRDRAVKQGAWQKPAEEKKLCRK
jgi:hypothetical protein